MPVFTVPTARQNLETHKRFKASELYIYKAMKNGFVKIVTPIGTIVHSESELTNILKDFGLHLHLREMYQIALDTLVEARENEQND
jgi:hypothetical protein